MTYQMLQIFIFILVPVLLLLFGYLWLSKPPDVDELASDAHPVDSYEDALERIQALRAQEGSEYNPVCRLKFMDHGEKAERAIIFIHGYTNCPEQFRQLGEMFFERGYNVLITPQPAMGLADRMNKEHGRLTAEILAAYTDAMIDIAQGLGEHISLAGLSAGGVMAAWAIQKRSDLDLAVIISPNFGIKALPDFLTIPAMNLFRKLPNVYLWWDPIKKLEVTPYYGYPRFSTRALAEYLRIGAVLYEEACLKQPAGGEILVITNAADNSVDNVQTDRVIQCWRQQGFQPIATYCFEASHKLGHDMIDPLQPYQRVDLVYPVLVDLIDRMGR